MLIMLKNGNTAGKESVLLPASKMKHAILECLKKEGYVADIATKMRQDHPVIEVKLVYVDKKPRITQVQRVSKQSRRVYLGIKDIHKIRNGSGLIVLSTPKGILGGKDARQQQVGGEALFKIW